MRGREIESGRGAREARKRAPKTLSSATPLHAGFFKSPLAIKAKDKIEGLSTD